MKNVKNEELMFVKEHIPTCLSCTKMKTMIPLIPDFLNLTMDKQIIKRQKYYDVSLSAILGTEEPEVILEHIEEMKKIQKKHPNRDIAVITEKLKKLCSNDVPDIEKIKSEKENLKKHYIEHRKFDVITKLVNTFNIYQDLPILEQTTKILTHYNKYCSFTDIISEQDNIIEENFFFKIEWESSKQKERRELKCLHYFFRIAYVIARLLKNDDKWNYNRIQYCSLIFEEMKKICNIDIKSSSSASACKNIFAQYCNFNSQNFYDFRERNCESETFLDRYYKQNKDCMDDEDDKDCMDDEDDKDCINDEDDKDCMDGSFWKRVCELPLDYQEIMINYLQLAPKDTSIIVRMLLKKEGIGFTALASYIHDEYNLDTLKSTLSKRKNFEEYMPLLCKAFLVSPDTIKTGSGIRYGSWTSLYPGDLHKLLAVQFHSKTGMELKYIFRDTINSIIRKDDATFQKTVRDFFPSCEEEIDLFEDQEFRYYSALINKEAADLLLDVLEKKSQSHMGFPLK